MADDIVTLLRTVVAVPHGVDIWTTTALEAADLIETQQAEIERLRDAGDALVGAIRSHNLTEAHLKTWEEARRRG